MLILGIVACGGGDENELVALPAFELTYAGSEELSRSEHPARTTITGPEPAWVARRLGVNASVDEVRAFFDRELRRMGWTTTSSAIGIAATSEVMAFALERDGVVFRFSVRRQDHPLSPPVEVTERFETIYEIALFAVGDD